MQFSPQSPGPSPAACRTVKKHASRYALSESPVVRRYLSAFRDTTGIILLYIPANIACNEFVQRLKKDALLSMVTQTRRGEVAYIEEMQSLINRVLEGRKPAGKGTVHGFAHFAVPVTFGGSTIGVLIAGPVRQKIPSFSDSHRYGHKIKPERRTTVKSLRGRAATPVLSRSQLKSATMILSMIADWIAGHYWSLTGIEEEPNCVTRARRYIEEHATDDLAVNDVGHYVCLSTDHLGKIFRRHMHITIGQYISAIRTDRAKQMLSSRSCRVIDAAFSAGFQSVAQFNRLFKQYAGVTPTEYRASARALVNSSRKSRTTSPLNE